MPFPFFECHICLADKKDRPQFITWNGRFPACKVCQYMSVCLAVEASVRASARAFVRMSDRETATAC